MANESNTPDGQANTPSVETIKGLEEEVERLKQIQQYIKDSPGISSVIDQQIYKSLLIEMQNRSPNESHGSLERRLHQEIEKLSKVKRVDQNQGIRPYALGIVLLVLSLILILANVLVLAH